MALAPKAKVERYKDNLKHVSDRLKTVMDSKIIALRHNLEKYIEMLKSRDVLNKLGKGLAYITDAKGRKIKSIKDTKVGNVILSRLKDGIIESKVTKIKKWWRNYEKSW